MAGSSTDLAQPPRVFARQIRAFGSEPIHGFPAGLERGRTLT